MKSRVERDVGMTNAENRQQTTLERDFDEVSISVQKPHAHSHITFGMPGCSVD